jgi:peptide deformylase
VLRSVAVAVTTFDRELAALVNDLMDTLDAEPGRAGVAAPQIGVGLRVFGYDTGDARGHLINPVLTGRWGEQIGPEACLSVPGMAFQTARAERVEASGVTVDGQPVTITGSGLLARALQHEIDHLDGVMYLDRLTGDVRRRAMRAVRSRRWAQRS